MACSGRYAEAYDYAVMFGCETPHTGTDDSGGGPNAFLTDTTVNFLQLGIPVLAVIRNATTGDYGRVTVVAANTLDTTIPWSDGDIYQVLSISGREVSTIEVYLDIAANDIHMARQANGGCDCTLSEASMEYLRKLNIIDAAIWHQCPCARPDFDDTVRLAYLNWITKELDNIRTGKIELCDGESGSEFPYVAWAEQGLTPWASAQIILNRIARKGS